MRTHALDLCNNIDTILLLKQISKKISSSKLNSTIEVEGTNNLRLSKDEIKHLINHDISKGSESKKQHS